MWSVRESDDSDEVGNYYAYVCITHSNAFYTPLEIVTWHYIPDLTRFYLHFLQSIDAFSVMNDMNKCTIYQPWNEMSDQSCW
jgi:hypothetical protein